MPIKLILSTLIILLNTIGLVLIMPRPALAVTCCDLSAPDPNAVCVSIEGPGWYCTTYLPSCTGGGFCSPPASPGSPNFRLPRYSDLSDVVGNFNPNFLMGELAGARNISDVLTALLPYALLIAGILLFAYLLYGGFTLVTSFGSPKAIMEAWLIIFRAVVGFILVFGSFWLVRAIEALFGLCILGNCG